MFKTEDDTQERSSWRELKAEMNRLNDLALQREIPRIIGNAGEEDQIRIMTANVGDRLANGTDLLVSSTFKTTGFEDTFKWLFSRVFT